MRVRAAQNTRKNRPRAEQRMPVNGEQLLSARPVSGQLERAEFVWNR
ncbi:MAG: hypothetical protein IH586_14500 [Anaerolineaceae bacterium]|nr:hypothetical protein [Anaerolineaceae bacterium]